MKYAVVMFPSKKLQDLANSYRKRYDPKYALISPHIKVISPFEATDSEVQEITRQFHSVASETSPLAIQVYKIKSFHPTTNTIYFAVKKSEELLGLHEALHRAKSDGEDPFAFVPHITIGQNLSDQEHSDVIGRLQMMDVNHEETIDRFHLMYQLDNESWTVHETFLFGKDC